jgi:aspartyl protease family protein
MRSRSKRNLFFSIGLGALGVALVVGGAFYWKHLERRAEAEKAAKAALPDYGEHAEKIESLTQHLGREPCDRKAILTLSEHLMRAGDARGTLRRASAFLGTCGEYPRLRWLTYAANKQLSQWDQAAVDATKLIESDPYDADFRGWRGMVYEQKGDLARAADDFRQALILRPRLQDLPLNLANAYEKLGRPCDAILPLVQVAYYHPDVQNIGGVHERIARLASSEQCAWAAGEGQARIKMEMGADVVLVDVRVNDRESGRFVVDTGATLVVLSKKFAERIALDLKNAPVIVAQTANGIGTGRLVSLDDVKVQGIRAARVTAAVVDDLGDIDGLLGMSFLSRFDLRQAGGVFEISARKR